MGCGKTHASQSDHSSIEDEEIDFVIPEISLKTWVCQSAWEKRRRAAKGNSPSHSSATRKIDRMSTATVARSRLAKNTLNNLPSRVCFLVVSVSSFPFRQRNAKSATTSRKAVRLIACRSRPAIMTSNPFRCCGNVSAVSASAPPTACRTSDRVSEVMNVIATVRGRKRDSEAPYMTMMRARHKYIAAEMKTGAMVRVIK